MVTPWYEHCHPEWADALEPVAPQLTAIWGCLEDESAAGRAWLPAPHLVMRAFSRPLSEVRVLIVGQDPYPTPGDAVGLSFSVAPDRPLPRSLANIARELRDDTGETLTSGDLTPWQSQGVMLLNRVLTVRASEAGSHRRRGWEHVTDHAIRVLTARGGPLVAVLWGNDAKRVAPLLGETPMIASAHPSPLSAHRGFFGSRPFSRTNALLATQGVERVAWGFAKGQDRSCVAPATEKPSR